MHKHIQFIVTHSILHVSTIIPRHRRVKDPSVEEKEGKEEGEEESTSKGFLPPGFLPSKTFRPRTSG